MGNPQGASALLDQIDIGTAADWMRAFGTQLANRSILFLVTLLALFFLLRDGEWLGRRALALADRMLGDPGERLAERLAFAVRGTVTGTVLVAIGEGVVIGVGYVVTGVPHAVLFAGLTVAFAMLPMDAWVAFTAASLLLLVQGSVLPAAGLFAFGAVVMSVGDHVVQPALIGGAVRLPFLWTLIGILGGLETFGLVGLFLGPVIMAAMLLVWREWIDPCAP